MAIRGQRFELDLSDDDDQFTARPIQEHPPSVGLLIGEIKERDPASAPSAPRFKSTTTATGFPAHRKRVQQQPSKFKQTQQQAANVSDGPRDAAGLAQYGMRGPSDQAIAHHIGKKHGISETDVEKQQIDQENKDRLASMSVAEIEDARRELMANLNPTLLERFLKKANIDDEAEQDGLAPQTQALPQPLKAPDSPPAKGLSTVDQADLPSHSASSTTTKAVSFSLPSEPENDQTQSQQSHPRTIIPPDDAEPTLPRQPPSSIHFPRSPDSYVPLDPSSPSFLTDLQRHYFPSLPSNPSTSSDPLSWLTSPAPATPYTTPTSTLPVSTLRFSFTAQLLPPKLSSEIPVTEGLHHHGHDPESAGYTIPELAMLGRSTVPGQKCISFMVLGRLLYRLGTGGFGVLGPHQKDERGILAEGLWECIERERVVEILMVEAGDGGRDGDSGQTGKKGKGNRHQSVKTYATEALWLWRKGLDDGRGTGGKERGIITASDE